jgi:hypothetical protein
VKNPAIAIVALLAASVSFAAANKLSNAVKIDQKGNVKVVTLPIILKHPAKAPAPAPIPTPGGITEQPMAVAQIASNFDIAPWIVPGYDRTG